jgi:sugar transferase (PEP-CTERM/EpsH1 system associated)
MNNEILFISHRMPFPPDRGDKIRSHHVLKRLAALAPVHVATFADDERDIAEEVELAAIAQSYRLVRRVKPVILAGAQAILQSKPVSLTAFAHAEMWQYIERLLRERPISTIYVFSGQMGQYVPDWFTGRVIFDFVDVDSAKFEAYAGHDRGLGSWVNRREAELLRREEARFAALADVSLLVSAEEAALFRARLPAEMAATCEVQALRNGIESRYFDPAIVRPEQRMLDCGGPRLIFTGQMDYAPNIQAALRVIERLLPEIRKLLPDASFHVVGRNPDEDLTAYHGRDGAYVWGGVEDMRPWLAAAELALVPLEIARGIQNKVLEAMSMSLPVVMTTAAATGIGGSAGVHYEVADSDADLVERVTGLLSHARRGWNMGIEARRYVVDNLSWQASLAPLARMLGEPPVRRRDAA